MRKSTAKVTWEDLTVSDNSGKVSVTCDLQTGTEFSIGLTKVKCEAVDESGNTDVCSFQVNVTGNSFLRFLTISQFSNEGNSMNIYV